MVKPNKEPRIITPEEVVEIREASIELVNTDNPFNMVGSVGRIVALGTTDSFDAQLASMYASLRGDVVYRSSIKYKATALGAYATTHLMGESLDPSPLEVYLGVVPGAAPRAHARMWLPTELDAYMFDGEVEAAKFLYRLGKKMGIANPVGWAALSATYWVADKLGRNSRR